LRCHAREALLVGDVPLAVVLRDLRIGTERTRAIDVAARRVRRDDSRRRNAALDPRFEGAERVKGVRPCAASAVAHAGSREEPEEFLRFGRPA